MKEVGEKLFATNYTAKTKIKELTENGQNIILYMDSKIWPHQTITCDGSWGETIAQKP
jgi:hypothetical protein